MELVVWLVRWTGSLKAINLLYPICFSYRNGVDCAPMFLLDTSLRRHDELIRPNLYRSSEQQRPQ